MRVVGMQSIWSALMRQRYRTYSPALPFPLRFFGARPLTFRKITLCLYMSWTVIQNWSRRDDSIPNGGFAPMLLWMPGQVIPDSHMINLPSSLDPGIYQVVAGLYRFANKERLAVSTNTGSLEDDAVALATFKIRADTPFTPANNLNAQFGSAIQLRGFTLSATDANGNSAANTDANSPAHISTASNTDLHLNLEWHATQAPQTDYTVFVHLLDSQNNLVRQQDNPPLNGQYKTSIWDAGEHVVDSYLLNLKQLPPGEYKLMLGMYESGGGERCTRIELARR